MKFIKKFEKFVAGPAVEPAVKPGKTKTKPSTRPNRPSPIRRDQPDVKPNPKAGKTASAEEVANTFIEELNKAGESVEKYIK